MLLTACGGGGAALPTEPGTELPGENGGAPVDPPGDDGGGDGGTGGGGSQPVTVTVSVAEGDDGGFSPSSVTVPVGSTVVWQMVDDEHDVTFVGPAPAGGNIPATDEDESASRRFDQPGTYEYFCALHADDEDDAHRGVVIVQAAGDDGGGDGEPEQPGSTVSVTTPGDSFSPRTVTIAAGGTVAWTISGDMHNVTFTGATPPGGHIPNTEGQTVSRSFPTAGRYDYLCTRHSGMMGAVVVQ